jgi:Zn-dependent alcohol dehydrogenase
MESKAAILWNLGEEWSVEPIELDPPKGREVQVKLAASGMCHSDEHFATGDLPIMMPLIGGHEGAGVVEAVGPDVVDVAPGDHVVFSFVPSCGQCPSCAAGHSNLCDNGAALMGGLQLDGTSRHHARDRRRQLRHRRDHQHVTAGRDQSAKDEHHLSRRAEDRATLRGCRCQYDPKHYTNKKGCEAAPYGLNNSDLIRD